MYCELKTECISNNLCDTCKHAIYEMDMLRLDRRYNSDLECVDSDFVIHKIKNVIKIEKIDNRWILHYKKG